MACENPGDFWCDASKDPKVDGGSDLSYQWVQMLPSDFLNEWIYTKNGDVGKGNSFKTS